MSTTVSGEPNPISSPAGKLWECRFCGFIFRGEAPPVECPQCSSPGREYREKQEKEKLRYDREPFDILVINGSSHARNNTGFMVDLAEEVLKEREISYRRYNLNKFEIQHFWCCYSM